MSFWETVGLGALEDFATDIYHKVTGIPTEDEKRNQQRMISDQIKAYQEQTELTRQELNTKREEVAAEKRRVNEKQIRALRRNYSGAGMGGFLGSQPSDQSGMSSKLGG